MSKRFSLVHAVREPVQRTDKPAPVLLMLHGVGSNEQDLMGLAPRLDPRFFVVSARAPITLQHGSYGWYNVQFTADGHLFDPAQAEASRVTILQFLDEIADSYNVNSDQAYIMGFSQGCIVSISAALTQPRRFAGVVGMSGRLLPGILDKAASAEELRGLPILIVHGTEDSVLAVECGRAIRDALEKLPVGLTYREYRMAHQVTDESLSDIEHWLSECLDSSHDWRVMRSNVAR